MNRLVIPCTLIVAVGLALGFTTMQSAAVDGPARNADCCTVDKTETFQVERGLYAEGFAWLSEPLLRTREAQDATRVVTASLILRVGQVMLATTGVHAVVGVGDSDELRMDLGTTNLDNAKVFAADILGAETCPYSPARDMSGNYYVTIGPKRGMTWGRATTAADLEFQVHPVDGR